MLHGKMKGQAFISLPSVNVTKKAVDETNAFVLNGKPIVAVRLFFIIKTIILIIDTLISFYKI